MLVEGIRKTMDGDKICLYITLIFFFEYYKGKYICGKKNLGDLAVENIEVYFPYNFT
jgi:hypothetical protein